jgi:hypothetical protein
MSTLQGIGKIVTNGLVMYLDAANSISYVSGSTTWNDLSGNKNSGSLTTSGSGAVSASFNSANQGSIQFNGNGLSGSYTLLKSGSGIDVGNFFTVQSWVKIDRFGGLISGVFNRAAIISNSYPYVLNQGFLFMCTSQAAGTLLPTAGQETFFLSLGADNNLAIAQTGSLTSYVGAWVNLAATVSGSTLIKLYVNGIEPTYSAQTTGSTSLLYTGGPCCIGSRNSNTEFLSGSIGIFSMYNRALTVAEILQNYNTHKARFGIR